MTVTNSLSDVSEQEAIAAKTLALAKAQGATQAEVHLSISEGFSVNVRNGDIETLEQTREKNLTVTVYLEQRVATATSSDLSDSALHALVSKACKIATYTNEDPYAGLAEPERLAKHFPELDLYHPWSVTPSQAIALGVQCEEKLRSSDSRITQIDGVSVDSYQFLNVYANSCGFLNGCRSTRHSLSCTAIAEESGLMQRDYEYTVARDKDSLDTPEVLAKKAAIKVLRRLGAKSLKTTRCPVIFEAQMARSLLNHFVRAISGANLYRKASFLLDHLGEAIFPSFVRIWQEPHLKKAWASTNYDYDGVATQNLDYIKNGLLESYVLGQYSARRLGMQTTGNAGGVFNLFINNSGQDFKALLKQMERGLVVTELMGQGVNLLTGDYSRGAFGFWVENGEIQYPVEGITIAGNLRDLFANLVAISNDVDTRSNIQTGSILLAEMMVAGE